MSESQNDYAELVAPAYRAHADQLLTAIVDVIGDAVVAINADQQIIVFNRGAQAMFGYAPGQVLGQSLDILLPPESRGQHAGLVAGFAAEPSVTRRMGERRTIHGVRRDGSRFPAGATIAHLEFPFGRVMVAVVRDISKHVETRERLQESLRLEEARARTDPLTGVRNLRALQDALQRELARLGRGAAPLTLVYIDLDHFKPINDTFGHAFGDEVLVTIAQRLDGFVRDMDVVARIGGDEFAILMPEADGESLRARVTQLHELLLEDMRQAQSGVTFSIGVLTCTAVPDSVETCMHEADALMYRVKHSTRNAIEFGTLPV
jgi:diguanylate cyclase (GGDEF)-like protein/PAS domain S-box-containing protein